MINLSRFLLLQTGTEPETVQHTQIMRMHIDTETKRVELTLTCNLYDNYSSVHFSRK